MSKRDKFLSKIKNQKKKVSYEGSKKLKDFETQAQEFEERTKGKSENQEEIYKKQLIQAQEKLNKAAEDIKAKNETIDNIVKHMDLLKGSLSKMAAESAAAIQKLKQENEDLKKALEFYAEGEHYRRSSFNVIKLLDKGERASKLLEQYNGDK